ncbi:SDR family NAD(P)-dependent oxidoreductase [Sphaerimonospora thailandensis]|uniref:Oxidoreductase n=1 Tax=Sphaerimonospora thailandensis TaxID=795644 RepID=A0A8J3RBD2_9ACTN|nr:SDR family oxidoreductase [Sphaerimonospora thailandensis]GIH72577.1 oxidoreductase [Sphaerimonospora thailandensis]
MTSASPFPVVIVTGGSRGIGREIVERLARQGRAVLFTHSASDTDAAEVERACGVGAPVWGVRLDITAPDAPARLFDLAESKGKLVALVNNAGVTGPLGPFTSLRDDDLRRITEVNLVATARLCREAARRWSDRPSGERRDIVNVSSIAARTGAPHEYVVYAATKAAINALTVGLAKELASSGIHVNAVCPGTTNTTIHARAGDADRPQRVAASIPMRRPAQPAEIAAAVSWLLSPEAGYVTGTLLDVAGGL